MRFHKLVILVLLLFNSVLLLGQVWPEGAPPFARAANIVFAACNLTFLGFCLLRPPSERGAQE